MVILICVQAKKEMKEKASDKGHKEASYITLFGLGGFFGQNKSIFGWKACNENKLGIKSYIGFDSETNGLSRGALIKDYPKTWLL